MPDSEDHEVLDIIAGRLNKRTDYWQATRESDSVEFVDPMSGRRYEIVVRPIDGRINAADDARQQGVAAAREAGVCRVCGKPIASWEWITVDGNREYAHTACLKQEAKIEESKHA